MTACDFIPSDNIPNIPDVLTRNGLWDLIYIYDRQTKPDVLTDKELNDKNFDFCKNKRPYPTSMSFTCTTNIPEAEDICPECNKGWNIKTHSDCVKINDTEVISLEPFIGKTLGWVRENYQSCIASSYELINKSRKHKYTLVNPKNSCLKNSKYIDLSEKYPETEHDWEKGIKVNEFGWVCVDDNHIIEEGDEGHFYKSTCYHKECRKEMIASKTEKEMKAIFEGASYHDLSFSRIKNEYWGDADHASPWFNVKTVFGVIKIGWRKRVINIDYSAVNSDPDFSSEEVTKGNRTIHAWSYEKAQEYLQKIRMAYVD